MLPIERTVEVDVRQRKIRILDLLLDERLFASIGNSNRSEKGERSSATASFQK